MGLIPLDSSSVFRRFRGITSTSTLSAVYPQSYPENLAFPCIVLLEDAEGKSFFNKYCSMPAPFPRIPVKRGFESIVSEVYPTGAALSFTIDTFTIDLPFYPENNVMWTTKSSTITGNEVWSAHSRIHITDDIIIDADNSLTIEQGSVIVIDKNVYFFISGSLFINGLMDNVIIFTSVQQNELWGGMVISGNNAEVIISDSIFMNSGGNKNMGHGHSETQPLFMAAKNTSLTYRSVYIINNGGQAFGGQGATVSIQDSLVQECVTGGQFSDCHLTITESCFTDLPEESPEFLNILQINWFSPLNNAIVWSISLCY